MLTQTSIESLVLTPNPKETLISIFETQSYHTYFPSNVRNFFRLPENAEIYQIIYPMYFIDNRFDFIIKGNFECLPLSAIQTSFALKTNSSLFSSIKNWIVQVDVRRDSNEPFITNKTLVEQLESNENENKNEETFNYSIDVIPVAMLPLLISRLNNHPLHYLIQLQVLPEIDHLIKYKKQLEIVVLAEVWKKYYGSEITLIYQERVFGSTYVVDASIHLSSKKLCLEIDEKGHSGYEKESEDLRHSTIKSISMNILSFDGRGSTSKKLNMEKLHDFLENVDRGIETMRDIDSATFERIISEVNVKSKEVGQLISNMLGKTIFSSGFPITKEDILALKPSLINNKEIGFQRLIKKWNNAEHMLMIIQKQLYEMMNKVHNETSSEFSEHKRLLWIFRDEVAIIARNNGIEVYFDESSEDVLVKAQSGWVYLPFFDVVEEKKEFSESGYVKSKTEVFYTDCREPKTEVFYTDCREPKTEVFYTDCREPQRSHKTHVTQTKSKKLSSIVVFKQPKTGGGTQKKLVRFSRMFLYRYLMSIQETDETARAMMDAILKCYEHVPQIIGKLKSLISESKQKAENVYSFGVKAGVEKGKEQVYSTVVENKKIQEKFEIDHKLLKTKYLSSINTINNLNDQIASLNNQIQNLEIEVKNKDENSLLIEELKTQYNILYGQKKELELFMETKSQKIADENQVLFQELQIRESNFLTLSEWYSTLYERVFGIKLTNELIAPPEEKQMVEARVIVDLTQEKQFESKLSDSSVFESETKQSFNDRSNNPIYLKYPWLPEENVSYTYLKAMFDGQSYPKKFTFKQFTNELIDSGIRVEKIRGVKTFYFDF